MCTSRCAAGMPLPAGLCGCGGGRRGAGRWAGAWHSMHACAVQRRSDTIRDEERLCLAQPRREHSRATGPRHRRCCRGPRGSCSALCPTWSSSLRCCQPSWAGGSSQAAWHGAAGAPLRRRPAASLSCAAGRGAGGLPAPHASHSHACMCCTSWLCLSQPAIPSSRPAPASGEQCGVRPAGPPTPGCTTHALRAACRRRGTW